LDQSACGADSVLCSFYDFDIEGCPLEDACFPKELGCPNPMYNSNGCRLDLSRPFDPATEMPCPGPIGFDVSGSGTLQFFQKK